MDHSGQGLTGSFSILRQKGAGIKQMLDRINSGEAYKKHQRMQINIVIRPHAIYSSLIVEARCEQNTHSIVQISNKKGKIIRMFGWYLLKGANITTVHELDPGCLNEYKIVISDNQGNLLFESPLSATA